MKVNVNKYKYDKWHVPLSIYFDEFIVSWIFQKLYVFTITKNIFPIIFYTNLWVTIWYKFLTGIIQTIFETHQLYINMQNFIHNLHNIHIQWFQFCQLFKNSIFQISNSRYHALQTWLLYEISNFYKSKLIEWRIIIYRIFEKFESKIHWQKDLLLNQILN